MSHPNASIFTLQPMQVPDYPAAGNYADQLRWCVAVMDDDDMDLGFAASLLAHHCKTGGLTEKQLKYGDKTIARTRTSYESNNLKCQQPVPAGPRLIASNGDTA